MLFCVCPVTDHRIKGVKMWPKKIINGTLAGFCATLLFLPHFEVTRSLKKFRKIVYIIAEIMTNTILLHTDMRSYRHGGKTAAQAQ